jgi:hypothetical protein
MMMDWVFHTCFEKIDGFHVFYGDQGTTSKFLEQFGERLEKRWADTHADYFLRSTKTSVQFD